MPAFAQQVEDSNEAGVADGNDGDAGHLDVLVGTVGHVHPGAVAQPDSLEEDLDSFEGGEEEQTFLQTETTLCRYEHIEVQCGDGRHQSPTARSNEVCGHNSVKHGTVLHEKVLVLGRVCLYGRVIKPVVAVGEKLGRFHGRCLRHNRRVGLGV